MNGFLKIPKLKEVHRYSKPIVLVAVLFGLVAAPTAHAEIALFDLIFKTKKGDAADTNKSISVPGESVPGTRLETIKTIRMNVTNYTSRPQETDGSPFITADGSVVRDGIVATNVLPFGTKVRIPTLFGEKIFVVRDRMNARYSYNIDVWVPDLGEAKKFGVKRHVPIEVVEMGNGIKNWDQWKGRGVELNRVGKYGPALPPLPQPYLAMAENES